jgi:3',5'-cyclic AMP phosphodiesterase CpdA
LEEQLERIDHDNLNRSIRIALIHHHPVLLPPLAEPGRGYDAVHNSGKLLEIPRQYGFHIILHGHKHNPHTFTDDTCPAHQDTSSNPILIAACGSVGSNSLPHWPRMANCYNKIMVKWHPDGQQARIRVETRGLSIYKKGGAEQLPTRWNWYVMRIDDRRFSGFNHIPIPKDWDEREFSEEFDATFEEMRCNEYERTRGNLPVVEVMPSLVPGQAYEAVLCVQTR